MSGEPDDFDVPDYDPAHEKRNPPDFVLRAMHPVTGKWAAVGAGWQGKKGVRIYLNLGVQLRWDDGMTLMLLKNEPRER